MAALSQTAANVVPSTGPQYENVTAGGTVTAGMPVYKDLTDSNKHKAARSNVLATSIVAGIAMNGASNNQPLVIQKRGDINLGATLAVGELYGCSDAVAGQIFPYSDYGTGDFPYVIGMAKTASILTLGLFSSGVAKA